MGFEPLSDKPRLIQRKNDNNYLIGQYDDLNDSIIPMKATIMDINKVLESIKGSVLRKEIKTKSSINIEKQL